MTYLFFGARGCIIESPAAAAQAPPGYFIWILGSLTLTDAALRAGGLSCDAVSANLGREVSDGYGVACGDDTVHAACRCICDVCRRTASNSELF